MWGNRLGWVIAAMIALVYGVAVGMYAHTANARSAPTGLAQQARAIEPIQLPIPPTVAVPRMSDHADGARFYKLAIAHYRANQRAYDTFAERGKPGTKEAAALDGIAQMLEAAPTTSMNLFGHAPDALVRYGVNEDLEALRKLSSIAVRLGLLLEKENNPDDATRHYEAVFSLGAKLFAERVTYPEMEMGISLMGLVSERLQKLAKERVDTEQAATLARFENGRKQFYAERMQPMARVLRSVDAGVVGTHAGDVFDIAEHATDRMWRIEALLALGRMRFFVGQGGTLGNQRGASQVIKKYLNDPDPFVRHAAKVAHDITIEQYRMLG